MRRLMLAFRIWRASKVWCANSYSFSRAWRSAGVWK
jgi:hypothetical protein